MAVYATLQDLETYYGEAEVLIVADRDGDGTADEGVVSGALTSASEEVDSYLAVRFDVPLNAIPGVLKRICADVAMYRMAMVGHAGMTDDRRTAYEDAVAWLKNVSKGIVTLGIEEEEVEVNDVTTMSSGSNTRIFTRTTQRGLF